MRAVIVERFGDPDGLALVDVPIPDAAPNEVLIEVEAAGVGGVDAMIRRGALGTEIPAGTVLGGEVAGRVVSVGAQVAAEWVGQRVWAATGTSGGYAEFARARLGDVVRLPDLLSSVDAVALGSAGTVAHFALAHAHLAPDESVLVRGAGGSIGIATVELASRAGSPVTVTASSAARGARFREFGATHVVDRAGEGAAGVPRDFDVVIDVVGGRDVASFLDRLAPRGRYILVGAVAGLPPADFGSTLLAGFVRSRSFATFSLATIPETSRHDVRVQQFRAAVRGELHAVVEEVRGLEDAAEAHALMESGAVFGRIVLVNPR